MATQTAQLSVHKYDKLGAEDAVRVLVLKPALDNADALQGDIIQYSRLKELGSPDTTRLYSAVSYTWGDSPEFSHHITCDSGASYLPITSKVDILLRYLRHQYKPRYLWIDAICLNQVDDDEKSRQIPLMGDIYRQAKKAYIWLGEDHDGVAGNIFGLLRQLAALPSDSESEKVQKVVLDALGADYDNILHRFWTRDWFLRRWIIQEASLPLHSVIQCGKESLSLVWVISAFRQLDKIDSSARYAVKTILKLSEPSNSLIDLLWNFHLSACSDKRDRIFALYGLLPSEQQQEIDYASHWTEVYLKHAAQLKQLTAPHKLLLHLFLFGPITDAHNAAIPSWVPNWSNERSFDLPYLGWTRDLEEACPEVVSQDPIVFQPDPDRTKLIFHGNTLFYSRQESGDRRVASVFRYHGPRVSTWADVVRVLEPLTRHLRDTHKARHLGYKAMEHEEDGRPLNTLPNLIAAMLIFHGVSTESLAAVSAHVESSLSLLATSHESTSPSDICLQLMVGFCDLLSRFTLFQIESSLEWCSEWGLGHQGIMQGDILIDLWAPRTMMTTNQEVLRKHTLFRIMVAVRQLTNAVDVGGPRPIFGWNRRHTRRVRKLLKSPETSSGAHISLDDIATARYIGPAFCIIGLDPIGSPDAAVLIV